ncbi:RsmE family RNA methyltransferase [Lacunimicrobium album]
MDRFYSGPGISIVDQESLSGQFLLQGDEAHHLVRVLRAKPGLRIELFNGQGFVAEGEVVAVKKNEAVIQLLRVWFEEKDRPALTVAVCFPKGDRLTTMIEKLCELGVSRVVPLISERSVVDPGEGKLQRLEKLAMSACKQSKRAWLMEMESPVEIGAYLEKDENCVLLDPRAKKRFLDVAVESRRVQKDLTCLIGPEGGWSTGELEMFEQKQVVGCVLGKSVLRIETAAMAVASVWASA